MSIDFQQRLLNQKAKRHRVHRTLTLWLIIIASVITLYYCLFYRYVGITSLSWLAAGSGLVYLLLGLAVLKRINLFLVFRLYIITTFIAFLFEIIYTGGINSSVIPHLIYIPLLSLFYGRRADLIAFFLLTLGAVLALFVYQRVFLYPLPNLIEDEGLILIFNLTNYLFILFAVIPIAFFFKYEIQKVNKSLKKAIIDQQETYEQLVHSEKLASIGQLTAGVAHEVNNPANFLQMGSQQLMRSFDEMKEYATFQEKILNELFQLLAEKGLGVEEWRQQIANKKSDFDWEELLTETETNLGVMNDGASRIVEIVRSLTAFSRKDEIFAAQYSIHQGIESTLLLLKNEWYGRVEIHREFVDLPSIECNPGNINQVLLNIISNAIQAIHEEGQISICTKYLVKRDMISVAVSDSGKGISKEQIKSIFNPFFTTKEVGEGTGLGLAISKRIIENHGGQINVESEPGKGSTFEILLPVKQTETGPVGELTEPQKFPAF